MGLLYVDKSCEIYLGGEKDTYREDMTGLPLECIITEEEYNDLPAEKKKEYEILVAKPEK